MKEEEKAIGLLDSGLGGLSVFREVKNGLSILEILLMLHMGRRLIFRFLLMLSPLLTFYCKKESN